MYQCSVHCTWIGVGLELPFPCRSPICDVCCCRMGVESRKVSWICRRGRVGIGTVVGPKGVRACQVQVVERMIVILYCLGTVHEMQDELDEIA
jgi:hypothetical protein